MSAVRSHAAEISVGLGCTNTVRSAAATTSWWPLGTRASTLRAKCTRHRCQLAPCGVLRAAAFKPSWESEMTRRTPASPRPRNERRNPGSTTASNHASAPTSCSAGSRCYSSVSLSVAPGSRGGASPSRWDGSTPSRSPGLPAPSPRPHHSTKFNRALLTPAAWLRHPASPTCTPPEQAQRAQTDAFTAWTHAPTRRNGASHQLTPQNDITVCPSTAEPGFDGGRGVGAEGGQGVSR